MSYRRVWGLVGALWIFGCPLPSQWPVSTFMFLCGTEWAVLSKPWSVLLDNFSFFSMSGYGVLVTSNDTSQTRTSWESF